MINLKLNSFFVFFLSCHFSFTVRFCFGGLVELGFLFGSRPLSWGISGGISAHGFSFYAAHFICVVFSRFLLPVLLLDGFTVFRALPVFGLGFLFGRSRLFGFGLVDLLGGGLGVSCRSS
jgi:hypothetical protein